MTGHDEADLEGLLASLDLEPAPIVWLTGAGISAESGIPTFRGPEGYWKVGSRNYHPQELATFAAFQQIPLEVWSWYLYRRSVCRRATPNIAHQALAQLCARHPDSVQLITQNVDGLHLRAGHEVDATFQIHGNIDYHRCSVGCSKDILPVPSVFDGSFDKDRILSEAEASPLRCHCGARTRPHVLWFDECYDETWFRFESSLEAALATPLLIVVGTSGATNLPMQIGATVARRGAAMIVINQDESPFSDLSERLPRGRFLKGSATTWVPNVCRLLEARLGTFED